MDSPHFGTLQCPYCEFQVCIHDDGWHLADDDPENSDFDALRELGEAHIKIHEENE